MNARVAELLNKIHECHVELFKIRSECPHPSFYVGMCSWRVGAFHPSRICNECEKSIPGITDEESKKVWKEHNKAFGD